MFSVERIRRYTWSLPCAARRLPQRFLSPAFSQGKCQAAII
ncbi:hypothetical protein HMPREF9555_01735 [Selenomonas artemidis F0399]|uniref:Uncharacterized protein n=1 Tax=Selenomonas artemidis F0399 TaxID=749551 RepID=E7N3Z5_9FIRM|nr:hypothetical protein HMPREF9555_01735 [Selenomonas artemidis F0399]